MHRINGIIGKPVVSAETGNRLGSVVDALLEEGGVGLVGLVIDGGLLAKEHVLPFRDVKTLGGDAVLARSTSGIVGPKEWRLTGAKAIRSSALTGRSVVTIGGHRVGALSDVLVDEKTGVLEAVEIATPHFGGLRTKRAILRASEKMHIGPDAVVVPDVAIDGTGEHETDDRAHPQREAHHAAANATTNKARMTITSQKNAGDA